MRLLLFLLLAGSCFNTQSQTNVITGESHVWVFKKGGKLSGNVTDFKGTNIAIITSSKDWKPYAINISDLEEDDESYITDLRSSLNFVREGYLEITVKSLENFPERTRNKKVFMILEFEELDSSRVAIYFRPYADSYLGIYARDRERAHFRCMYADKKSFTDILTKLNKGDRILVTGETREIGSSEWLNTETITRLSPKKKKAIKE